MRRFLLLFLFLIPLPTHATTPCNPNHPTVTFEAYAGDIQLLMDGYFLWDGVDCWWTPGVITTSFWMDTPLHYTTRALWQSEGVMESTAEWKGISLSEVAGGIALNSCAYDGQLAHIRPPNFDWIAVKVVDCANRLHTYYHAVPVDSALELNYALAESLGIVDHVNNGGGIGLYGMEVCLTELSLCSGNGVDYKNWFLDHVQYEVHL